MKIWMLPKWYPNKFDEFEGIFVVDHVRAIAQNHKVFLLFIHSDKAKNWGKREHHSTKFGYQELHVYFGYLKTGWRFLDKFQILLLYYWHLFMAARKVRKSWGKPDLIHVHVLLRSSVLALFYKWFRKVPFIVTEHFSGYDPKNRYHFSFIRKLLTRLVLNQSAGVSVVSEYLKSHLKNYTSNASIHVISNAIDSTIFCLNENDLQPKKASLDVSTKTKTQFIHVSTLDDYPKNFGGMLQAIKILANKRSDFEFRIYGFGVELEKQKQRAQELNLLNSSVFFEGSLPKEIVAIKMAQADAMVLFSHYETQSCVLLESFMCGVPAIAAAVGGVPEIVTVSNGLLVPHDDKNAFALACEQIISETELFDKNHIHLEAKQRCSYEAVAIKFELLYQSVFEKRKTKN